MGERIHVVLQRLESLGHHLVAETVPLAAREGVVVEVDDELLLLEFQFVEFQGGIPEGHTVALLVGDSVEEVEYQMALVGRDSHLARLGQGDSRVAVVSGVVVDEQLVHQLGLVVPLLDAEDVAFDAVIEGSGGDFDLLLGVGDVLPEGVDLVVCHRNQVIGGEEGAYADEDRDHD